MRQFIYAVGVLCLIMSCAPKSSDPVEIAYGKYSSQPNSESAKDFFKILNTVLTTTSGDKLHSYLAKAYTIAREHNMTGEQLAYGVPLLKLTPLTTEREDVLYDILRIMNDRNNRVTADILGLGYIQHFPNGKYLSEVKSMVQRSHISPTMILDHLGKKSLRDVKGSGLDVGMAQRFVNGCEAYALVFSKEKNTPDYLMKAGEMASALKTYDKALELYDWIIDVYPTSPQAPLVAFMKAFLLESELNNLPQAKEAYQDFLQHYPDHHLVGDVTFLLDNLGKSEDDILKLMTTDNQVNAE